MQFILEPWPWYVSGPLIGFVMLFLLFAGKGFGMSSNLRTACSIAGAGKVADFFRFDWKKQLWNLLVVGGAIIGGFIAAHYLSADTSVDLNPATVASLEGMGMKDVGQTYVPNEIFGALSDLTPFKIVLTLIGGLLVGFGARYAGGCTSGHAISGLSNLQLPSLIAVIGFFIGGIIMTHLILPLIF